VRKKKVKTPKKECKVRKTQGMCDTVALPFTLKGILRQKKDLWNLKYYFTMKN
jgi:hypothetical protein